MDDLAPVVSDHDPVFNSIRLCLASRFGDTRYVELLLAAGADVHADSDAALRDASAYGHVPVVELLLAAGADVHADGNDALHWASWEGHALQWIITHGEY